MAGMDNVIQGAWAVLFIGVIIFAINIVLTLNYTSYASTRNSLLTQYCAPNQLNCGTGTAANTGCSDQLQHVRGPEQRDVQSNLNIVIVALVLIVILLAVLLGISAARGSMSGGTLK